MLGTYRDVFCKKNKIYYEAQVKRLREPKKPEDKLKILFHFKGWSPKFDEWIEAGSDRIRCVLTNVLINPVLSTLCVQETDVSDSDRVATPHF